MTELARCPCGAADPRPLGADLIVPGGTLWAVRCGVCRQWSVLFDADRNKPISEFIFEAWNAAPRGRAE